MREVGHLNTIAVPLVTGLSLRRRTGSKCYPFAHLVDRGGEAWLRCSTPNSQRELCRSKEAEKWGHDCQRISRYKSSKLVDRCQRAPTHSLPVRISACWPLERMSCPRRRNRARERHIPKSSPMTGTWKAYRGTSSGFLLSFEARSTYQSQVRTYIEHPCL